MREETSDLLVVAAVTAAAKSAGIVMMESLVELLRLNTAMLGMESQGELRGYKWMG